MAWKTKEMKSAPPSFQPKSVEGLKFGVGGGPEPNPMVDTKRRRARGEDWEKSVLDMRRKEIKMGPTNTSHIVFGGKNGTDAEVEDYMARFKSHPSNSNSDKPGSSRHVGVQINDA